MKRKQYREEKIISILKEHEAGASVPDLARSTAGSRSSAAWTSRTRRSARAREPEAEAAARGSRARQGGAEGAGLGKMVTASQRRRAVNHLKSRRISERRACRLVRFSRSAAWYRLQGRNDGALRERLKQLAQDYPRYGCPTLHGLPALRLLGLVLLPQQQPRHAAARELGVNVSKIGFRPPIRRRHRSTVQLRVQCFLVQLVGQRPGKPCLARSPQALLHRRQRAADGRRDLPALQPCGLQPQHLENLAHG